MAEGARLESVFRGNSNQGSNPCLSAIYSRFCRVARFRNFLCHFNDRFHGTITLRQDGSDVSGVWHTSKGKSEPDDSVSGRIDGGTLTLWRFIGDAQQHFVLNLSADRSRLDGYGDGFFLSHTNLNMRRVVESPASGATALPQSK